MVLSPLERELIGRKVREAIPDGIGYMLIVVEERQDQEGGINRGTGISTNLPSEGVIPFLENAIKVANKNKNRGEFSN